MHHEYIHLLVECVAGQPKHNIPYWFRGLGVDGLHNSASHMFADAATWQHGQATWSRDHCNVATWQHGQKMSWVLGNMALLPAPVAQDLGQRVKR